MLYVESPVGVGFSYSIDKSFYTNVNDEITCIYHLTLFGIFMRKFIKKYGHFIN
jgi:serine carboxypeptidase-like clade 2